jgi:hypothetical protein
MACSLRCCRDTGQPKSGNAYVRILPVP